MRLNCWEDMQVIPAPVSNNHFLTMIGPDIISINGLVSYLRNTSLISNTSLLANFMQVCRIRFIIDGSPKIFCDHIDCFGGLLVVLFRCSNVACKTSLISFCRCCLVGYLVIVVLLHFDDSGFS
jgi:hypothetical protein